MHAVQSALAIRRERERRQSLKGKNGRKPSLPTAGPAGPTQSGIPSDFRSSESTNGSFNYTTVGVAFIIFGSLMMIPILAGGSEFAGLDWRHLLGIGGLLIAVGVLMIVVHLLTDDEESVIDKTMDKYKAKVKRSGSKNPIIEDVEYGVDSRRNSMNSQVDSSLPAKHFEQEPGGVVKV